MEKKVCSLFLLLFFTLSLHAQSNRFTVKGEVIDSLTNETVPYVTLSIALAATPQTPVKLLAADENGRFETTLAAEGDYLLSMQSIGKAPVKRLFSVSDSKKVANLGKILMQEDDQRLGEVTVTAQKPLVKIDIDKITYSLEDDPEAKTNTTLEMLRKVPMVTVDGEDQVQLKGSSNFKFYLNGKPSNMLSSNNASDVLKSMPASSVKNIEIITDPGAKYDAEGVGGIINIITTKNALQGYTGTVNSEVSTQGSFSAGGNVTTKAGKLGLTANYNYRRNNRPWGDYELERTNYGNFASTIRQSGRNINTGPMQFGTLEASYELDTLNLISVGANLFNGNFKNRKKIHSAFEAQSAGALPSYSYDQESTAIQTFGSTDINVDLQHSTKKKDELLTLSYRFSYAPSDNESHTYLLNVLDVPYADEYPKWNTNDASTKEHTAQIDYTTPTVKDQTLEGGLKYIMRQSSSETLERILNEQTNEWKDMPRPMSDFKHTQHIYSAYFTYAVKFNKFSAKAGVRAEGTALNVAYAKETDQNFNTNFFDLVPNATVSYQINMTQQIRFGYNMRISRPGIWYLNPYVNRNNPQSISYGNPNLESEKSHGFNLNYSMFTQKFNLNLNASYRFVNNAIEQYIFINDETGITESTYENLGKNQGAGLFVYARWNPVSLFTISFNGGLDYVDMNSSRGISNSGFMGRSFLDAQFKLPANFSATIYGGYASPWVQLQSKGSPYTFHGISVNKKLLKDKLTIGLSCHSPFQQYMKFDQTTDDPAFYQKTTNYYPMREFRLRVSYTFGTLKDSIKKVRRGIINDDAKSGGSNEGGGSTPVQ
ncbi:MAG: TonB-dependent receptor [Tannerellaceae bacterium]|jgi:outer membrane receptor protein involved in Fe transport|nr:TonB-dependent receptor [Tannerellaceae bacterium]